MTQAIQVEHTATRLYVAFEMSATQWRLAESVGGVRVREVVLEAGALDELGREISAAKQRFGLPEDAGVLSCYEAGRDGFWLHRWLLSQGVSNVVVDSSSIDVNRRARRAKTDRLDARKLLGKLVRYGQAEKDVWSVVRVPSVEEEDQRRRHREIERLKEERIAHSNRIRGLLCLHGLRLVPGPTFLTELKQARLFDGTSVPATLAAELRREYARLEQVRTQLAELEAERKELLRREQPAQQPCGGKVTSLMQLRGIGINCAWVLCFELFGWRVFANRRELAGAVGLTGTPYDSGGSQHDQGISKSGMPRVRTLLIEISWGWLRWQPDSALSKWFMTKFGSGNGRMRRVGIVALARRLLVALWQYVENGVVPEGALMKA